MDQKRLMLAIALSVAILLGFQAFMPKRPVPTALIDPIAAMAPQGAAPKPVTAAPATSGLTAQGEADRDAPRVKFTAARLEGSINLRGAKFDDLVLRDYRDTIEPNSPLVHLLEPRTEKQPYYVQFGWTADPSANLTLPGNDTLWTAEGTLSSTTPLTLHWNNGAGLEFQIIVGLDANFMFTIDQKVINSSSNPAAVFPYARIRRDYTPEVAGYYVLHEGFTGVLEGTLKEQKYSDAKSDGDKHSGVGLQATSTGGWAGFTDKYWLTALIADPKSEQIATYRHINENGDRYQVDFLAKNPLSIASGASGSQTLRLFAGAKEVRLLDHYEAADNVPSFDKAVDFGWFYFITKPFFYAVDYLNDLLGNFGLAILAFTLGLKLVFLPLANKSYRSMSKMKLLAPKVAALKEVYKDDQQKLQQAMMQLYKTEKVNPASGCLPMLIQIPIFFSLYKVIFVTIEMRQAPFFGWIHDLSAIDPTNVFNLFGLIPFDPGVYSNYLHLGVWPLIMGATMYFQQKLNPPPPDPMQAKMFQFMPIIFTFMLSSFPAGLVIYWSWNNALTILQQSLIMRGVRLGEGKNAVGAAKS
jgi:YidC/Oxa1 family membrane protein insertase